MTAPQNQAKRLLALAAMTVLAASTIALPVAAQEDPTLSGSYSDGYNESYSDRFSDSSDEEAKDRSDVAGDASGRDRNVPPSLRDRVGAVTDRVAPDRLPPRPDRSDVRDAFRDCVKDIDALAHKAHRAFMAYQRQARALEHRITLLEVKEYRVEAALDDPDLGDEEKAELVAKLERIESVQLKLVEKYADLHDAMQGLRERFHDAWKHNVRCMRDVATKMADRYDGFVTDVAGDLGDLDETAVTDLAADGFPVGPGAVAPGADPALSDGADPAYDGADTPSLDGTDEAGPADDA